MAAIDEITNISLESFTVMLKMPYEIMNYLGCVGTDSELLMIKIPTQYM